MVAVSHRKLEAPLDVSDRDYVTSRADGSRDLYIGIPLKSRVSLKSEGDWIVTFSLPILGERGEMLGICVATVDPAYFSRLYGGVDIDHKTQITIMRGDGILLARAPHTEELVGKSLAQGAIFREGLSRANEGLIRYTSIVDNTERISAFRRLRDWPLVLVVGSAISDLKGEWMERTLYVALPALFLLAVLTRMHYRQQGHLRAAQAASRALEEKEQRFRSVFDEAPVGHVLQRLSDGGFIACNPAFCEITGYRAEELARMTHGELMPDAGRELRARKREGLAATGRYGPFKERYVRKDGRVIAVRVSGALISAPDGEKQLLSVVEDIERQDVAEARVRLLASVFEHSGECIVVTDRDNRIVEVNPAFSRVTGYAPADVLGKDPKILSAGRTVPEEFQEMWKAIREQDFWQGELWDRHRDGHCYPKWLTISVLRDERGNITHHIGSFTDITAHKAAQERIHYLAHHDPLTQLPNRFHLQGRLEQALTAAREGGTALAVMFIDLDRFKNINDTLGHHMGDGLLVEVATALRGCVRSRDIVARLGGDEFVVVLPEVEKAGISRVAEKLLARVGEAVTVSGMELRITPSIGISLYPADGDSVEELMKNADLAMYHAKAQGRNNYQFFSQNLTEATAERLALEGGLARALEQGEFLLHYQPQVDVRTGRFVGVEALIRWRHPEMGLVPPLKFIPVAEDTGLILPLGRWVIEEALAQLAAWRQAGLAPLRMAVNLSAHQVRDPGLKEFIARQLSRHGLEGGALELEITESVAMQHPERTAALLHELREAGIALAIDDFGTGYSSLAYLKKLPLESQA